MHTVFNEIIDEFDEILHIEYIGVEETIDINVSGNRLFYANDILTHNSGTNEVEFDHSHISGGISKIQTADNVFGIYVTPRMKELGKYQLQFLKTRNSGGVGHKIELDFDVDTLRITNSSDQNTVHTGSTGSSILDSIKRKSETPDSTEPDVAKVKANTESTKLRQFLNNFSNE